MVEGGDHDPNDGVWKLESKSQARSWCCRRHEFNSTPCSCEDCSRVDSKIFGTVPRIVPDHNEWLTYAFVCKIGNSSSSLLDHVPIHASGTGTHGRSKPGRAKREIPGKPGCQCGDSPVFFTAGSRNFFGENSRVLRVEIHPCLSSSEQFIHTRLPE